MQVFQALDLHGNLSACAECSSIYLTMIQLGFVGGRQFYLIIINSFFYIDLAFNLLSRSIFIELEYTSDYM